MTTPADEYMKHHYISPKPTTILDWVWCSTCLAVVDRSMVGPHMGWHERTLTL